MLHSLDMRDYILHNPIKLKVDDSIVDAIDRILEHGVSGICVVDQHEHLVGVLSELDCMKAILAATYNRTPIGLISDFMTTDVVSVSLHENIVDVAQDMLAHKHRRRPVIDEDGTLLGQVTCRQLLRAVKDF